MRSIGIRFAALLVTLTLFLGACVGSAELAGFVREPLPDVSGQTLPEANAGSAVPFAATFTLAVAVIAVVDLISGSTNTRRESLHFLELAGLILLWVSGMRVGPGRGKGRGTMA